MSPIDLRSDTVTKPCAEMRKRMAEAEVGDDVYGEDPSVNALQERIAERLGKEAALFVPTGSMADQIALKVLTNPGDAVITAPDSHIAFHEAGASPWLSGVQFSFAPTGIFTADDVRAAFHDNDHHHPPTTVVEVENTYNMGGGQVWQPAQLHQVCDTAHELGMKVMLDGARLWNAALASETSEAKLCEKADLVTVCLSKGLGAPVGSLVAGSKDNIDHAHRIRKMLGGGMRQAGILAAAGLYAVEEGRKRLAEDHENAQALARAVRDTRGISLATEVESNILLVRVEKGDAQAWQEGAQAAGLLFWTTNPSHFRLVTHRDVSPAQCQGAAKILLDLGQQLAS